MADVIAVHECPKCHQIWEVMVVKEEEERVVYGDPEDGRCGECGAQGLIQEFLDV